MQVAERVQRILVVDDNAANRQVAEAHLVAAGYSVTLAENGLRSVDMFKERKPDLVLLDIMMPGMDGFDTCKVLKDLPGGRDVPVVFLTALSDLGSHQRAMESGAEDFLTKPINRTELLIRVRSLLWMKRLRDQLAEGYDLIRSQRDALLTAQRQKEELSQLVVHDLKNPLAVILGNSEYLVEEEYLREDDRDAIRSVVKAAESMHRMIMNLLDISRSEDGTLIPRPSRIDLRALVDEVCKTVKVRAREAGVALDAEVSVDAVVADRDLLLRMFENLIDNAIKFSPKDSTIRLSVRNENSFIAIRVSDEGEGVPHEYRERVFEKYAQLEHRGGTHIRSSRGLGLAFCRLAAEVHGGRIWVEDNAPKGSTFVAHLPANAESANDLQSN